MKDCASLNWKAYVDGWRWLNHIFGKSCYEFIYLIEYSKYFYMKTCHRVCSLSTKYMIVRVRAMLSLGQLAGIVCQPFGRAEYLLACLSKCLYFYDKLNVLS
ncbi:hypothetical protein T05_9178 [Trichinella murrelli]|uniref:Uncharacterized protein n=1 Tax=Trichinella murrelli TaxID=144512 RepID=A0A0V0UB11_9BILA|nr:hypothetical protein T05_9178 [Trichinella murrelli]